MSLNSTLECFNYAPKCLKVIKFSKPEETNLKKTQVEGA
jgi:hypothetical protein